MTDTDNSLTAPLVLEYPYTRTVGPVMGRFFTGLRDGRIEGIRAADGRVLVPPSEYDPTTSEPLSEWVAVSDHGEIVSWTWVTEPVEGNPFDRPFAWALIRLQGADTPLLHAVDAPREQLHTGLRVRARWRAEREGHIRDIECFEAAND
jgi:uncharacterized OB-fold protein